MKLEEKLRETMRVKHMSIHTENSYVQWYRRFVHFFELRRHPEEMGAPEVTAFLTHLAVEKNVAPSTQNQALNALVFLYRQMKAPLAAARIFYDEDQAAEVAGVYLPHALERKSSGDSKTWEWFWVFPSSSLSEDPRAEGTPLLFDPEAMVGLLTGRGVSD